MSRQTVNLSLKDCQRRSRTEGNEGSVKKKLQNRFLNSSYAMYPLCYAKCRYAIAASKATTRQKKKSQNRLLASSYAMYPLCYTQLRYTPLLQVSKMPVKISLPTLMKVCIFQISHKPYCPPPHVTSPEHSSGYPQVVATFLSDIGRKGAVVNGKLQLPLPLMLSRVPWAKGTDAAEDPINGTFCLATEVIGIG